MTIEELLTSMQTKYKKGAPDSIRGLQNTKETWTRIAGKDSFDEMGFASESEKEKFLREWISENPYSNI